jgi:hypothetical protein
MRLETAWLQGRGRNGRAFSVFAPRGRLGVPEMRSSVFERDSSRSWAGARVK